MAEYNGILEISEYAENLINSGQARVEGANVVWNSGFGKSGVVEWGKFRPASTEEIRNVESVALLAGGMALGMATVAIVGTTLYNRSKSKQDKANRINNNLISCLTLYILESHEHAVQPSTKLDLKLAIEEYIENTKLFKNKVDVQLLKNMEIITNDLEFAKESNLGEKIIQLNDFIKRNNSQKFNDDSSKTTLERKAN